MSQTKAFSEFLVEQGLLTADDLVTLLIEQARQLPTPAELVREHKLLDSKQLLSVFSHQMTTSKDFSQACKDLGYWTSGFESVLSSENDRLRIPVVQLLQKSGKVSTEDLVSALDSYLSESATKPSAAAKPAQAAPLAAVATAPAPSVHVETPVTGQVDASEESPLEHFREFYTDSMQSRMVALAKEWDQSDASGTDALIDRVHGLVGAARFAKLSELEELFKNAESNIRALADCATPLPQAAIESFRQELVTSFEKGWTLRESAEAASLQNEVAV